ncbi:MAG TPA: hypothetical protein VEG63_01540, partial [Candidatus Acidoferrales bacterium]|nr:hypothetical protein [Candidatus Acidoferrales bacterium]
LDYSMRHNWEQQQEKRQTPDCSRPKLTTEQALDHTTCRRESLKANLTKTIFSFVVPRNPSAVRWC